MHALLTKTKLIHHCPMKRYRFYVFSASRYCIWVTKILVKTKKQFGMLLLNWKHIFNFAARLLGFGFQCDIATGTTPPQPVNREHTVLNDEIIVAARRKRGRPRKVASKLDTAQTSELPRLPTADLVDSSCSLHVDKVMCHYLSQNSSVNYSLSENFYQPDIW